MIDLGEKIPLYPIVQTIKKGENPELTHTDSSVMAYSSIPDVSCEDVDRIQKAIEICKAQSEGNSIRLIGADMSGIQKFIYQILSKYAAKNLKGRSFYLRLLSQAIVHYTLDTLNLPEDNIIYNSGGGFYIIAPDSKETIAKIEAISEELERRMFNEYGNTLYIAIDSVELPLSVLDHTSAKSLSDVWTDLYNARDSKKNARFSKMLKNNYGAFFKTSGKGADCQIDAITGDEITKGEESRFDPKDKDKVISRNTKIQIDLGSILKKSHGDYLIKKPGENAPSNSFVVDPLNLGYKFCFKEDKNAEVNTFEDLLEETEGNLNRLGVLRMDVDNLGSIFQGGIDKTRASLERNRALSRQMDFYFDKKLKEIQTKPEYASSTDIIYSGGDDIFIVGKWDKCIQIAHEIQEGFKKYTFHNPAFSISGGIAIIEPKFPIMKGAALAAKEEDNAKDHSCNEFDKNSISFLNFAMNWDEEYPMIKELKDTIMDMSKDKTLPQSFISKILSHHANSGMKKHKITKVKTYWMLTYDLGRLKGREAGAKNLIDNCICEVCNNNKMLNGKKIKTQYHALELWAFACRWAELELRTN